MKLVPFVSVMALAMSALSSIGLAANAAPAYHVYYGTYTNNVSKGIYRSTFDAATGTLSAPELALETSSPSFLALHPTQPFLYAVDESASPQKTPGKGISAISIDPASGKLTLLNQQSNGGEGGCYITVDNSGKVVLVANYSSGSVTSVKLESDGRLGAVGSLVQHTGSSVNPQRQKEPHAHEAKVSADNRYVFVPDLGLDKVMVYALDAANATLKPAPTPSASVPGGSGPRHIAFHPNNKYAYVINELLCTVSAFQYDAAKGELTKEFQNLTTLPEGVERARNFSTAEIMVHPNGKFVYGSTRGHNSITVWSVDANTGALTQVQNQSTLGNGPRYFTFDPTGNWLLVANQNAGGSVAVFRIDTATGKLTQQGQPLAVPTPVCAVFVPVK